MMMKQKNLSNFNFIQPKLLKSKITPFSASSVNFNPNIAILIGYFFLVIFQIWYVLSGNECANALYNTNHRSTLHVSIVMGF